MNQIYEGQNTIKIMYVGPKAVKTDTVTGFRPQLRFKRNEATDTPVIVANHLLGFSCFVIATEDALKAAEDAEAERIKQEEEEALKAEAMKQKELDDQDTTVTVDDEVIDLGKFTFSELEAFRLAHELEATRLDAEPKPDLVKRVRDEFREKPGKNNQ